jgi:hypothetical protein
VSAGSAAPAGAGEGAQAAAGEPGAAGWPLVSVIVPTRGRPRQVRQAVAAVAGQTYPGEIECIVVHDQEPPDPGLARLATGRCRVTVTANERAPGLAGARNTGLALATGRYIAGCDDDDAWHAAKLERQIGRRLADPGRLAGGSGLRRRLPGGRVITWPARAEVIGYPLLLRNRVKELHSSTLVMRREAFDRAGVYDEELPGGYAEDYDWVLRLARAGRVGAVTEPLADITKDTGSWYAGRAAATAAGLEQLLAKHPDIAASRRGHARMLGQIALARSLLGDRRRALACAGRAIARWPASPHPYLALTQLATGIGPGRLRRLARLLRRGLA